MDAASEAAQSNHRLGMSPGTGGRLVRWEPYGNGIATAAVSGPFPLVVRKLTFIERNVTLVGGKLPIVERNVTIVDRKLAIVERKVTIVDRKLPIDVRPRLVWSDLPADRTLSAYLSMAYVM